jgi:DNA-binding transcriptional LysR family regulator
MAAFIASHPHIQVEFVTHPFPVSVRKREADLVLRIFQGEDENLVGRKIARLGVGFYASRDYAARHPLPKRRDDWSRHHFVGFADRASNAELGKWSERVAADALVAMRCSSQADMLAAVRAGVGISVLSCFVGDAHSDLVRVLPNKLMGSSDIWLLAHPDLVDLPAMRAVLAFITSRAREDGRLLSGARGS